MREIVSNRREEGEEGRREVKRERGERGSGEMWEMHCF
jgi:hypothetical protein